jgi:hypothetical protein
LGSTRPVDYFTQFLNEDEDEENNNTIEYVSHPRPQVWPMGCFPRVKTSWEPHSRDNAGQRAGAVIGHTGRRSRAN